jgi:alpha-mannosidase
LSSSISATLAQTRTSATTPRRQTAARQSHGPSTNTVRPNLAKDRTLYVVGYAHLDTEWRWEYPQVIQEYLTKTMRNNFMLFEKYPSYIFNFTGANRYRLMKEYYPSDFERLKQYVAADAGFRRIVDGRRRCELTKCRVDFQADSLWQ